MEELFVSFCEHLSNHVWLQAVLVIIGTCFLEDVARCAVVVMVAGGHIRWPVAFVCMTIGGMVGDVGLYIIGRFAIHFLARHHWVDLDRVEAMKKRFRGHVLWAVFVARFLPGARMLVYITSGSLKYPVLPFNVVLLSACAFQAWLFLLAAHFIETNILPYLNNRTTQILLATLLIGSMFLLNRAFAKKTDAQR